ncbi:MAG: PQQ-like beta-propeller repeat protein [Myxococcales bacterium]|nr:PQQ-like beta-propeller repeat protein [Myxococcales bacterium]
MVRVGPIPLIVGFLALGCSFLNDFPDVVEQAGGAGAGVQGGNANVGGSCNGTLVPEPQLLWHATPNGAGQAEDYTIITGLTRDGSLSAWGMNAGGFADAPALDAFPGTTNRAFLVDLAAAPPVTLRGTLIACDTINGPGFSTGRMALAGGDPLLTGALTEGNPDALYAFAVDASDPCAGTFADPPLHGVGAPTIGFNARLFPTVLANEQFGQAKGQSLDIASNGAVDASLGLGFGELNGVSAASPSYYLARSTRLPSEVLVLSHPIDEARFDGSDTSYGGVAVDDASAIWATGKDCSGSTRACAGTGRLFVDRWGPSAATADPLSVAGGGESFGSVVRAAGGVVVVGGGYQGELTVGDQPLPVSSDSVDGFVFALDPADGSIRWTYPGASAPDYDRAGFDAVVDLAVVPGPACGGFVYVAGCRVEAGAATTECLTRESHKSAFVAKLRLDTGEEIWSQSYSAIDPGDTSRLLPTAVAADEAGFWVAFSYQGQVDFLAETLTSNGASADGLILQFAP